VRMPGAPEGGFAEVNGASLYYDVAGNGEPLVLVHAGIADRRMWDGQLKAFAERYRVIRYDMRGCGRSEAPTGASFSHHDDLRGLLDFLGIERAILVGCTIGARTAIDFALALPERVRALALVCPSVSGFEPDLGEELPAEPPAANRLAETRAPALVVAGALDRPEVGARAELLAASIPRAQKVVIDGTAHVPGMERPEELNRVVLGFLAGVV
jgi:pimeloyl-ACP methyl ester carboxylesterase